jgi:hypothetical protein
MRKFSSISEAVKTPCQTPEAVFHVHINEDSIKCEVDLPFDLELSEDEAKELEGNIHNALELALSKYFIK